MTMFNAISRVVACSIAMHFAGLSIVAQDSKRTIEIVFYSADHVELAGTFYPSVREKSAPCVLLLHAIHGNRQTSGWEKLALKLQKEGYAVLSFDYRGHGQSKNVLPEFWQSPISRTFKPIANSAPNTINVEQFTRPSHFAMLVNDIRAARRVFELKGREGKCDATQIMIVGVETGASLGLLYIDAEWGRQRSAKDSAGRTTKQGPEALEIAGAVWLSFNRDWPGRFSAPIENWLVAPASERTPMGFLYVAGDSRGKSQATLAVEKLSKATKEGANKLTIAKDVPVSAQATGESLLESGVSVDEMIIAYLGNVGADHRRPVRSAPDLDQLPPIFSPEANGLR